MSPQKAYEELIRRSREVALLASCRGVLAWDQETYMPRAGAAYRGEQLALLTGMVHEKATAPEIGELLGEIEGSDRVNDPLAVEAVNVREIRRSYDRRVKLPRSLVEARTRAVAQAMQAWREAREADDFSRFRPHMEEVLRLRREEVAILDVGETLYDTLLDEHEPGATTVQLQQVFGGLRDELVPLVEAVVDSGRTPDVGILERSYPIAQQEVFGEMAAAAIGFDFEVGRLDVAAHPFTTTLGTEDTRITTRYNECLFSEAFFATLHEAGHGIHGQGLDRAHYGTPMGTAPSSGIAESQSRMWENAVGRGRAFWSFFFPRVQQVFPEALGDVAPEAFYFAINAVAPSFIRVEADEVTYNLHILLRFELEQALVAGDLPVSDVPGAWNETFGRYLGITPPDDVQGCLQDIHWSSGYFGYFPSYALGNLYAAQFFVQAREDLGDLDAQFAAGEFEPLKVWLTERIHRQGTRYRPDELVEVVTGKPLSHRPFVEYLKAKFGPLYGI